MKEVNFKGHECVIKKTRYMNNENLALILLDKITGELVAHVTINFTNKLPDDTAAVKDYSENEGMLKAIKEAGLVKAQMGSIQSGFISAPIVQFNLEDIEEM